MNDFTKFSLTGLVIMITHTLEAITGFGCTVLALPFVALLLGIKVAVPVLCVLAWLLAIYIVVRSRRMIKWKEFLFIIIYVGLGLPIGIILFDKLPAKTLSIVLACFMVSVGGLGFIKTIKNKAKSTGNLRAVSKNFIMKTFLFCGGIIHGAFSSGGPFVVIYAAKALPDKSLFRVTLCLLWSTLNTILMIHWTISGGVWSKEIAIAILITLPFLIGGMILGDYLHHKVDEYYFRISVYGVLGTSGIIMAISNIF